MIDRRLPWVTKSGHEATVERTWIGQYRALCRPVAPPDAPAVWIEIGAHYTTIDSASEACERLAKEYCEEHWEEWTQA